MQTIIVPLDFSDESLTGLDYSLLLAGKSGANINMVHVIDISNILIKNQLSQEYQSVKVQFEIILEKYKGQYNYEKLSYTVKEGTIYKEIINLAEISPDSVIVLSTKRESGINETIIGQNTYKITSHSRVPVITIRRDRLVSNINKIVVPLDITFQTREKVPFTAILAKLFNSEVHLISVRLTHLSSIESKLHQYVESVALFMGRQNISFTIEHLQGDNLTDMIIDYANSVNADLISIMTEQEQTISNIFKGSYAHQMINKALIPVLSFPNYPLRVTTEDIWDLGAFNARD